MSPRTARDAAVVDISSMAAELDDRDRPTVTVLTPVLDEGLVISGAVAAMLRQEDPGSGIELIFIDGRSGDRTREILAEFARTDSRITVLDNPDRITSTALNIGLAAARGEFVARMDAHASYPDDYLVQGVARLRRGGALHVSGPQIAVGVDRWSRRVAAALHTPLGIGGATFRRISDVEHEVRSGFTGVWRRETLERAGGWLASAYPNEDAELAARLRELGGTLVCVPGMAAEYLPRRSIPALSGQYWRYGKARARTAALHPRALDIGHLLPPAVVLLAASLLCPSRRVACSVPVALAWRSTRRRCA